MSKNKVSILITAGDPRGIGPEITEKALRDAQIKHLANFSVIEPRDKTGLDAVERAVRILRKGGADGLVTAPVNKSAINKSGIPFKGHTEYLASMTNTKKFAMMFCGAGLKVALVTRHMALRSVSKALSQEKIIDTTFLVYGALRRFFGITDPRIGVSGLNPHCGEDGLMGQEEQSIIIPAVKKLKRRIAGIKGPLPADAVFYMAYNRGLDAVISMYHDQGLAPFKMIAFQEGVNVTLGLPFVRTSPDHGTAYDIAKKGIADPQSMRQAIKLAVGMCKAATC